MKDLNQLQLEICKAFLRKYGFTQEETEKLLEKRQGAKQQ